MIFRSLYKKIIVEIQNIYTLKFIIDSQNNTTIKLLQNLFFKQIAR